MIEPYLPRRVGRSRFVDVRGLRYHLIEWGDASLATGDRPTLVMLHGWMDVAASFQFVVDALRDDRHVLAPDWRGFGLTQDGPADCYWFPDYLGDLDGLLDTLPEPRIDLLGHSMGGNVAMIYAGIRPQRVRRLINLEGFGLPESQPEKAAERYATWLDELKQPAVLRGYRSLDAVAARLMRNNPRLAPQRAAWLAARWAKPLDDGQWAILGDPAHKRRNPVPYQKKETLAIWQRIEAPAMWVEGAQTEVGKLWGDRYPRAEFEARIRIVRDIERHTLNDAGHMLHHDQPQALAILIDAFLHRG